MKAIVIFSSAFRVHSSAFSFVYVLVDGVAQFCGLFGVERACDGAALLETDDCDASVHLEVEGKAAAVFGLEDERGRDAGRAVGFKGHLAFSVRLLKLAIECERESEPPAVAGGSARPEPA